MTRISEPIEVATAPIEAGVEAGAETSGDIVDHAEGHAVQAAALEP